MHCASRSLIPQDLLSHIHVSMISFLRSLYLFHFCVFLSDSFHNYLSLYGGRQKKLAFNGHQSASHLWFSGRRNESNAKNSRFRPNRNLTGTIYHWSVILRRFSVVSNSRSAERDANGFFKVLLILAAMTPRTIRLPVKKLRRLLIKGET